MAPEGYNYAFCASLSELYLVQNILWLCLNKRNRLGFELFFMISFFFVNFAYPLIYAPTHPHWSFFMMNFNRHVINQATAMAYLAYTFYMIGITGVVIRKEEATHVDRHEISLTNIHLVFCIAVVSFVLFVGTGGYNALSHVYSGGADLRDVGLFSYFNNIFSICALLLAAMVFRIERRRRWLYLAFLLFCVMVLLRTGSRQLSISLVIILLVSYSWYVHHLRWWQLTGILLVGAIALFVVVQVRKVGLNTDSWAGKLASYRLVSIFDVFEDLSINAINLYVLVNWFNSHDLTWFHGMLLDLASPIPKLGTWIINRVNEAPELLHGGDLPSFILLGTGAHWGTGTNMVGEACRSFGVWGMCLVMYGIGALIRVAYYKSADNVYWYAFYMLMVGHAIIYPRAPLLYDPRTIVWAMIVLFVVQYCDKYVHAVQAKWKIKEETA